MSALHAAKAPPPFLGTCAGGPWDGLTYAAEYGVRQILAPEGLLGRYEHNGEGWDWVQVMPQAKFEQMDFGDAVRALKEGKRVARASWPKMVLQFTDGQVLRDRDGNSGKKDYWLPSQNDVLAEDWEIVE